MAVEVLAGRPQAQVGEVVLARPGQLSAREQRLPVRAAGSARRHPPPREPGRRVRGLHDLLLLSRPTCHSFFTGPVFFPRSFRSAFKRVMPAERFRGGRAGALPWTTLQEQSGRI